ncbi:MAG: DUF3592 domain-containing protein [Alphaproteobacteria bacterium]
MKESQSTIGAIAVLVLGFAMIVWGGKLIIYELDLWLKGDSATGTVVGVTKERNYFTGRHRLYDRYDWDVSVKFRTRQGRVITFRTEYDDRRYAVGDQVEVRYVTGAPQKAVILDSFWDWLIPFVLVIGGQGVVLVILWGVPGTPGLLNTGKQQRRRPPALPEHREARETLRNFSRQRKW